MNKLLLKNVSVPLIAVLLVYPASTKSIGFAVINDMNANSLLIDKVSPGVNVLEPKAP